MSFFDWIDKTLGTGFSEKTPGSRPLFSDVTWAQLEKQSQEKSDAANRAMLIESQGKSTAISSGFTLEQGLLGSTTRAGSPQSGLPQNQGLNFLDILKWNSQNAPSTFQETGKDKATALTINTPEGSSKTVQTASGSTTQQVAGTDKTQTGGIDWLMIVLILGAVFVLVTLIKKR